eukprot:TRINITY_DN34331_c0_g1_i1.p1 TRINITY_DN34331_c0_g1~~TRINITY_DN34331_c0_g1_i1.p1  ORF type:complete len:433 (+),score=93.03 TRINITY_DN34331_c0_g1_i1:102-1400(+)
MAAASLAQLVLRTQHGRVLQLHMNSPKNLNALSQNMIRALSAEFAPERLRGASVVLLTAEGRHFGAGHNLSEMAGAKDQGAACGCPNPTELFDECSQLMVSIASCEVPVVAAVRGCAFAAGCQLAASCDVVIASESARFATPGVKIGLFCSTPSVALTRAVGPKVAADMLFSARELTAKEAMHSGLVSRVVPKDVSVEEEALQACQTMAKSPREVLVNGKRLLLQQRGLGLTDAYKLASTAMDVGVRRDCAREGIGAFLDKRMPAWPAEEQELLQAAALAYEGVAVIGVSGNTERPSHGVFMGLQRRTQKAIPVNPQLQEVGGVAAYANVAAVPAGAFAVAVIFRAAGDAAAAAVDEVIDVARRSRSVRAVWLQEGVRAPEAEMRARSAGLLCVADRCISKELRRLTDAGVLKPLADEGQRLSSTSIPAARL